MKKTNEGLWFAVYFVGFLVDTAALVYGVMKTPKIDMIILKKVFGSDSS